MSIIKKILLGMFVFTLLIQALFLFIPLSAASQERPDTSFENSQWISVGDVELHYRTWIPENPNYQPIVYIHGLGGSTFSWRYNIDEYVDLGFPVIALDLPAFGYSTRQTGLTHSQENRSDWVFGLLDQLDAQGEINASEGYHLLGHSMGGGVITAMALNRPEDIQTLTYIAGAVMNEPPRVRSLLSFPPLKRGIAVLGEYVFFTENRLEEVLSSAYGEEVDQDTLDGYLHPLTLPGTGRAWGDLVTSTTSFDEEDVEDISLPVFLIWGNEDSWVPIEEGHRLNNLLPKAELTVIQGSGHTPMETDIVEFNNRLLAFLIGEYSGAE